MYSTALILSLLLNLQSVTAVLPTAQQIATNNSQRRMTITMEKVKLEAALREIERQSGSRLIFGADVVPVDRVVSLHVNNSSVYDALAQALSGTNIIVRTAPTGEIALVRGTSLKAKAVAGIVMGKVTDAKTGKAISGATISAGTSDHSVTTSEDGTYRLSVASGTLVITVRTLGYAKQSRSVTLGDGATVTADFKLEPNASVLNDVVVTGTIIATELKAVPNAITVITAKQIEERGITRIDQLFRGDIPGLFSLNLGSTSALDEVAMFSRGATALVQGTSGSAGINNSIGALTNSIKTYIDGVEMADSKYLSQIDPSSIERIEILTGPQASTIYGSNAINGVMQIFTKRGMGNKPQLTTTLNSGVAQNNFSSTVAPSHLADARVTGIEGRISYNAGGSWNYIGSWTPGKQTQRLSASGGARMDAGKLTADVSARKGLTKTKQNGSDIQGVTGLRESGVLSVSGLAGIPKPSTRNLDGRTAGLTLSYRPLSWWHNELVVGSDASNTGITVLPGFGGTRGNDTTLSISSIAEVRRSERYSSTVELPVSSLATFNLTLGADHWRATTTSWDASSLNSLTGSFSSSNNVEVIRGNPDKNTGAFAQGQLGFHDALFLTYGLRADWNPNFGDDVKVKPGRYGFSYTQEIGQISAKLRGSYGRSIRPPASGIALPISSAELGYNTDPIFDQMYGTIDLWLANPALGPEHQSGGEGGVELYFGSRGSIVVTRYNQTVDNLISLVENVDSVRSLIPSLYGGGGCDLEFLPDAEGHCYYPQRQYLNVGSIRNQGWETQGSMNIGPFSTRGTYTWSKSRILGVTPRYRALLSGSAFEPGRPFDYFPEHTWALGVTYAHSRSTVSLSVNGTGLRYVENNSLTVSGGSSGRLQASRLRMQDWSDIYRPIGSGYATADLNAAHKFSSNIDALLQVNNLTNYYQNDFSASYASIGRQSRVGLRIRWQ